MSKGIAYIKMKLAILALCLMCATDLLAQEIFGFDHEASAVVSAYIKDIRKGDVLCDYNSQLLLTPASIMKSVTSATVLANVDSPFRFVTQVKLQGENLSASTWRGNIVVESVGDPTLESANFKEYGGFCDSICAALKALGVLKIEGNIVVEQNFPDSGPMVKWEIEDVPWPYGTGVFGFNYRDNVARVFPFSKRTVPFVPDFEIELVAKEGSDDLERGAWSNHLKVYTQCKHDQKWCIQASIPNPSAVFRHELESKMEKTGIRLIKNDVVNAKSKEILLYSHSSPTIIEILQSLMFRSDNLFAEAVLRLLSPDSSRKKAIARELTFWQDKALAAKQQIVFDGSGLARGNRLQAIFLANVLEKMALSPMSASYISLFPKAGCDGTMKSFLSDSQLKSKIALKTGSMNAVQTYAGYKLDNFGVPSHVIVIMVNGFVCKRSQVKSTIAAFINDMFAESQP